MPPLEFNESESGRSARAAINVQSDGRLSITVRRPSEVSAGGPSSQFRLSLTDYPDAVLLSGKNRRQIRRRETLPSLQLLLGHQIDELTLRSVTGSGLGFRWRCGCRAAG